MGQVEKEPLTDVPLRLSLLEQSNYFADFTNRRLEGLVLRRPPKLFPRQTSKLIQDLYQPQLTLGVVGVFLKVVSPPPKITLILLADCSNL
jgi:hypothetical protein